MSKCLFWKISSNASTWVINFPICCFLYRSHSLSFIYLFLSGVFTSGHHLNERGFFDAQCLCVCVSVGSTWFFLYKTCQQMSRKRSPRSKVHKINFSCGCEVNFWRNIWNGSPLICVTDFAHPYNLDDPKNPVSWTHAHQHASARAILPAHSFFPVDDYLYFLLTHISDIRLHICFS